MRDLYAKTYGSDYSMGDPKESESKIDSLHHIAKELLHMSVLFRCLYPLNSYFQGFGA